MAIPTWLDNLIAYSLQMAILASAGTLLAYLFRLRVPRVCLTYWQILLFVCLILPGLQHWKHPVQFQSVPSSDFVVYEIPKQVAVASAKPSLRITPEMIGLAIGAGAGLRLLWLALGYWRLQRFLRRSQFLSAKPPLEQSLVFGIGARARFFLSNEIDSPATFGVIAPAIILPASFTSLSGECREAVVCHELLHVRRRDWAVILVEEIVRAIYWFHPAVWWLLGRIHLAREQSVDQEVVQLTGSRQPYLNSLLEIARSRGRPRAVPAPLFLKERHLVQRVALLIKEVSMNRLRLAVSLAGMAMLLTGTVRLAAGWFPMTGEPQIMRQQLEVPKAVVPAPDPVTKAIKAVPAPKTQLAANNHAALEPEKSIKTDVVESREAAANNTQEAPIARQPIRVGGNVQESKLIKKVEPVYPEVAKSARVQGIVVMVVTVDEQGSVSDVRVNSGHPLLSDAAIAAVKQWQYSPTLLNGVAVPVMTTVTVVFNMDPTGQGGSVSPFSRMDQDSGNRPIDVFGLQVPAVPGSRPGPATLMRSGSPTMQYEGRQYYAVTEEISAPELTLNQDRLRMLAASGTSSGPKAPFVYYVFVSETGRIVGLRRIQTQSLSGTDGSPAPEIENELARTPVISPARRGSEPVPVWLPIIIERP